MNLWKLACGFFVATFYLPAAIAASQAPVGNWVTVDDKTGEKRAIVNISQSGGTLSAVIDKVYPQPGDTGICDKCPGECKGNKVRGLRFMWGLKNQGENEWSGGSILDPKSGKVYSAKITVQGNKLLVRGYLGVSLLGRTQIWHKE
ncbi:MAG: DUF2147 domain-containing protein [Legionella sp.]